MTFEEAIEITEVERACVKRNTDNKCDRDCINCDLLRTEEEIFAAYDMAIKALEKQTNSCSNCKQGEATSGAWLYCLNLGCFINNNNLCRDWEKEE